MMNDSRTFRVAVALYFFVFVEGVGCIAQTKGSWSARTAGTIMAGEKDSMGGQPLKWTYDQELLLEGMEGLWHHCGDGGYFKYIQRYADRCIDERGEMPDGRILLLLYKVTNQEKYYKAATLLRAQTKDRPGAQEVGLLPFYAEYAALFHEDSTFDDITKPFMSIEKHTLDPGTGLIRAQAMCWYGKALVDALDYLPVGAGGDREALVALLRRYAGAIIKGQDRGTGLWGDDATVNCLFVYTLAKGVRKGYLPASVLEAAKKGYAGILKKFVATDEKGAVSLGGDAGIGRKVVVNDPKGMGAFLLAGNEMDLLADIGLGKGRTVQLDYFFNNERKKDITGANVRFHYTWEDEANSGFSELGHIFRQYGMHTDSLPGAPRPEKLQHAAIYIIVDPDDEKESPFPNYATTEDIQYIYDWVKNGGVLLLMSNDSGNCEFPRFNRLAERFGIHFNEDCRNKVVGNNYEMGAFRLPPGDSIFRTARKIYIKEMSTIRLSEPAKAHFTEGKDVIMAVAKVGKGTVFAVGDPWFYNEYLDGRKLPAEYENFKAANDLVKWMILQSAN